MSMDVIFKTTFYRLYFIYAYIFNFLLLAVYLAFKVWLKLKAQHVFRTFQF